MVQSPRPIVLRGGALDSHRRRRSSRAEGLFGPPLSTAICLRPPCSLEFWNFQFRGLSTVTGAGDCRDPGLSTVTGAGDWRQRLSRTWALDSHRRRRLSRTWALDSHRRRRLSRTWALDSHRRRRLSRTWALEPGLSTVTGAGDCGEPGLLTVTGAGDCREPGLSSQRRRRTVENLGSAVTGAGDCREPGLSTAICLTSWILELFNSEGSRQSQAPATVETLGSRQSQTPANCREPGLPAVRAPLDSHRRRRTVENLFTLFDRNL